MKIDFTVLLKDQDDQPLLDTIAMQANGGIKVELSLGRAATHSLQVQSQDERELSGEEKFYRGMLSFNIRDNADADLKVEDMALIKKQLAKLYSPIVVYRAYLLLEQKESPTSA